jgi:alpha-1,2-mannosyltransferase
MTDTSNRQAIRPLRACLLVAVTIAILIGGIYFANLSGRDPHAYGNDFNVFYFASREVIEGRDPYERSTGDWTPYLYPPLLAELIAPLGLLPLPVASYLWFIVSVTSLVISIQMLIALRHVDSCSNSRTEGISRIWLKGHDLSRVSNIFDSLPAALTFLLLARFTLDNFSLGQVNLVVASLCIAHVFFFVRNRRFYSIISLALAASIKLTPALIIGWHLAKLRFRFATECAVAMAVLLLLSFAPFGADARTAFESFFNRTIRNQQGFDLAYAGNQSLRGSVERAVSSLDSSDDAQTRAGIISLALCLVFFAIALFSSARATGPLSQAAPVFCCLVLLSPLSWKAHFVLLLLPIFALAVQVEASRSRRKRFFLIASLAVVFTCFNLTSPKIIGLAAAEWVDAHSVVLLGALALFGASVATSILYSDNRDADSGQPVKPSVNLKT